jgi:hypothetical protein
MHYMILMSKKNDVTKEIRGNQIGAISLYGPVAKNLAIICFKRNVYFLHIIT